MGSISITNTEEKDAVQIELTDDSKLGINSIDRVQNIDPVAIHIKEVNHIDPLSIDALHIKEVNNIDPIQVAKFNVTNLPMVNVSLRQLPDIEINLKTLPPITVGTHQTFCIPSNYTLRARFLGVELIRLNLDGQTMVIPKERYRREQSRSPNKSFPETSVAGNPAIPSSCLKSTEHSHCSPSGKPSHTNAHKHQPQPNQQMGRVFPGKQAARDQANTSSSTLSFGKPRMSFQIPDQPEEQNYSETRVMSGD